MGPYDQQDLNRRRKMAMMLQQQQPVQGAVNPLAAGLANMARGLVGKHRMGKVDEEQEALTADTQAKRQAMIGSMGNQGGMLGKLLQSGMPQYEDMAIQGLVKQQMQRPQQMAQQETDKTAPWRNISDPKKRDDAKIRYGAAADTQINKARETTAKGLSMNDDLQRFIALNEENYTGGWINVPLAETARSFDPEFNEMKSISDKLTPQMRQGMPGAASDRDVAMFRSATVGVNKQPEANKNIALGMIARNQNAADRVSFLEQYRMEKGHLNGADREWKKYIDANPIFDHANKDKFVLNEGRKSYDEWASGQGQPSGGAAGGIKFLGFE